MTQPGRCIARVRVGPKDNRRTETVVSPSYDKLLRRIYNQYGSDCVVISVVHKPK